LDILERTQYFAALDLELKESGAPGTLRDEHQRIADLISSPRDAQGTFADSGISGDVSTIVGELRRRITVSVSEAIHSADANRKFDPVIRLTGSFSRPAEGMLAVNMLSVAALSDADRSSRQSNAARLARLTKQRKLLQTQLDAATDTLIAVIKRWSRKSNASGHGLQDSMSVWIRSAMPSAVFVLSIRCLFRHRKTQC
jgi:hypothetical protein